MGREQHAERRDANDMNQAERHGRKDVDEDALHPVAPFGSNVSPPVGFCAALVVSTKTKLLPFPMMRSELADNVAASVPLGVSYRTSIAPGVKVGLM